MREVTPTPPTPVSVTEEDLQDALHPAGTFHSVEISELLSDLRRAHDAVISGEDAAVPEYNFLTARLIDHIEKDELHPWAKPLDFGTEAPITRLEGARDCSYGTEGFTLAPSDTMEFSGKYSTRPNIQPGIGATLISYSDQPPERLGPLPPDVRAKTLTAIVRFNQSVATLDLIDPYSQEFTTLGPRRLPLAADYISNTCFTLSKTRIDKFGLIRLIRADRFDNTAGIHRIQPYDRDRIPVLLVHGLQDTPATFAPMYYNLMADPEIRERFQFWIYSYPSGYPYPWSAALLRRELDRMKTECPGHKDIVIVGHSMGGLISRLMVTDAGDRIWTRLFGKPPEQTGIRGSSRNLLEESLVFRKRDDISRAIFLNAPHQGSDLAIAWIGRLGSRLVRLPSSLANIRDSLVSVVTLDTSGFVLDRVPNSIDTLSPKSAIIRAVNQVPISPDIPYHTIAGDRGLGNTPNSSDGVVAYWSSHLEGAESERIVPSWHSGHQSAEGIDEVRRILRKHAGLPPGESYFIPPNPGPSVVDFHQGPISKH